MLYVGNMEFSCGSVSEMIDDFGRLMLANAEEVGVHGRETFLPNTKMYRELESQGKLIVFLARNNGVPAGYQVFHIGNHPHYAGSTWGL